MPSGRLWTLGIEHSTLWPLESNTPAIWLFFPCPLHACYVFSHQLKCICPMSLSQATTVTWAWAWPMSPWWGPALKDITVQQEPPSPPRTPVLSAPTTPGSAQTVPQDVCPAPLVSTVLPSDWPCPQVRLRITLYSILFYSILFYSKIPCSVCFCFSFIQIPMFCIDFL